MPSPSSPDWLDRAAWPWMPRWTPGGMHYVDEGRGPALVCVHGTPTWGFEWRHVLAGLQDARRVVVPDHLGFGLSARPPGAEYTPEAHAVRFGSFMTQVVPAGPVDVCVHDFGGPIAFDWVLEHSSRVRHLVVVNSWMWSFAGDASMRRKATFAGGRLGRFLYRRLNASLKLIMPSAYGDRRRLTPSIHRQYLEVFPDADSRERVLFALAKALLGSSDFYQSLWDRRTRLAGVPMTIVWGMKDSAFPRALLNQWCEAFPHAHIVRMEESGHWPHEEEPDRFVAALRSALGCQL